MTTQRQDHLAQLDSTATSDASTIVEAGAAFMRLAGLDGAPDAPGSAQTSGSRTRTTAKHEHFDVIVIGGGQTGLSVGYHLKQQGVQRFLIIDASARIGDAWRKRWDSLCLFSPAWASELDGLHFPGPRHALPTKDQMADYLEGYAAHFELPVRSGTRVDSLTRNASGYVVQTSTGTLEADQVIIAMASYQQARTPEFARELRADIVQMHSTAYKNPGQLRPGSVVVVGGGNSGAEIARELRGTHQVVLAAPDVGEVPFRMDTWFGTHIFARFLLRFIFHYVLSIRTPMGRKARPRMMHRPTPLIRVMRKHLVKAGVKLAERVLGVRDGLPVTQDGQTLDVQNVIWCTGFDASRSFIKLPIFDDSGEPIHETGVVTKEPGMYFVGLPFMYSASSAMIHGVGRDAKRIAGVVKARAQAQARATADGVYMTVEPSC